jgi:type IV secretion system protein VirD4
VREASKYKNGGLPRRVNVVADEFCNCRIQNLDRSLSAHRSRNIRWFLVAQSKRQLEQIYEKEADVIMANCANLYFLSSPELSLLQYLSEKAGRTTITESGLSEPLISVQDLQGLKKGWQKTECYFTSKDISFFTELPDISSYPYLKKYEGRKYDLPKLRTNQIVEVYTAEDMLNGIKNSYTYKINRELDQKFGELFGNG